LKAVVLRETGAPDRLQLVDAPEPQATEGQAVMRVRAAGVNFLDVLVRQGRYPQPPPLPTVLGTEVAGEVDGRRVMALPRVGGYAESALVDRDALVPLPDDASFEEGAAFLMTYLTAHIPLTRQARVEPGSTVLVHAGAGGVGCAAIQLAKHWGARVVATASSEEKRAFARQQGADEAWSYDEFADNVRADLVIDPVGGPVFAQSLPVVNPLGSVVAIGFAAGWWEDLNPALLTGRNISVHGFYLGRLMRHRPEVVRDAIAEVMALWVQGAVRPVVGATFPLEDAAAAHELIEQRCSVGKVVLVP
jgi:NADPH:quinone reductase